MHMACTRQIFPDCLVAVTAYKLAIVSGLLLYGRGTENDQRLFIYEFTVVEK